MKARNRNFYEYDKNNLKYMEITAHFAYKHSALAEAGSIGLVQRKIVVAYKEKDKEETLRLLTRDMEKELAALLKAEHVFYVPDAMVHELTNGYVPFEKEYPAPEVTQHKGWDTRSIGSNPDVITLKFLAHHVCIKDDE